MADHIGLDEAVLDTKDGSAIFDEGSAYDPVVTVSFGKMS